jgi:DNA-binding NarL/FixJ family response regulator
MEEAPLILCCEDEPALRRDIADELREAGYRVREAENGVQALAILAECAPDLILCDIMMPGVDGYGVLAQFRRDFPHLADVPLVFLSALSMAEAVIRGKRAGADDYLPKPIDYDLLLATIEARLRQRRQAGAAHAPTASIGRHLLEHLAIGVLAFDHEGRLSQINPAARRLLGIEQAAFQDLARGQIREKLPASLLPNLRDPLQQMVEAARAGREESIAVTLATEQSRLALMFSCPDPSEGPAVLAYLTDPQQRTPLSADMLGEFFALTPTEAQVAGHLAQGLRPDEVAARMGVSSTTVAFHLRNIFGKTGANRQADLVALLLSLPVHRYT